MKLYQLLNEFQQPIKGTWSDWDTLGNEILKIPNNRVTPQVYRKLIVPAQNQSMYGYVDRNDPSFSQYDIGQMVDADHNIMTGTPSSRSAVKNLPSKAVEYLRTASQKFPILQQKQLDQQRATSKEAIQQNNDALIMLHSSDKDAQIQGARKILNAVLNHNDDATAQEANQVLSSVIQVASTPTTPQAKVNFIRSHLGISSVAAALLLLAGFKWVKKSMKNYANKPENNYRIAEQVISLYREGYLSRDNALLALEFLK